MMPEIKLLVAKEMNPFRDYDTFQGLQTITKPRKGLPVTSQPHSKDKAVTECIARSRKPEIRIGACEKLGRIWAVFSRKLFFTVLIGIEATCVYLYTLT